MLNQKLKWIFNTFSGSVFNTVISTFSIVLLFFLINNLLGFISNSEWAVVTENRRLLLIGRMPQEEEWRAWSILWISSFLIFSSLKSFISPSKKELTFISVLVLIVCLIFTTESSIIKVIITLLISSFSYLLTKYISTTPFIDKFNKFLIFFWICLVPLIICILLVADGPKPTLWGGFLLNIILACVAIGIGFPLGLLFALGRASSLPAIKIVCTIYIETIRGAPLVAWLLLAWFVLPKFLPEFWGLNDISVVVRAMIILSAFTSAYTAEVIRGGLQSIPKGQIEAADSLNLNVFTKTSIIILPQAIRVVIPALISTFIGVFKDTSLVFILALTDLLQVGRIIPEQDPEFFGKALEALCVVAFMFWIVSIALSNISTRVEKSMGIGTR
jgi:general L-amino acid transport system permease protein|tara:strand:- start:560 stop:1723 length:1164 start_codon:yes stop_codon:yes gene_type:complete